MLAQHGLTLTRASHFLAAYWRRIFAPRALIAIGGRLMQWNQLVLTRPDQISAAHTGQRFAQHRPAFWIVITQERLVQATLFFTFNDGDAIAFVRNLAQRVLARVVHGRGGGHG